MLKVSVSDFRYKMNEILKAIDDNHSVEILYYGKRKAILIPANQMKTKRSVKDHPFFGSLKDERQDEKRH